MVTAKSELVELREGRIAFLVPTGYNVRGPGKRGGVFYNRQMELNRDVCISLLRAENRKLAVLDAMAASGVRSLRIAAELDKSVEVTANDSNPDAVELVGLNASRAGAENVFPSCMKANAVMAERSYDYIDIDPFGTPVWFAAQALMSVRSGGIVGVTATDSAVLCGAARGCERRYQCRARRWPFMHELGLRNLIGYLVRTGASFDRAVYPLLSYFADHYFRVYVRVRNGVQRAEVQLGRMGYVRYEGKTGRHWIESGQSEEAAGPAWTGSLHDADTVAAMKPEEWFGGAERMKKLLQLWRGEVDAPLLFYDADDLSSRFGISLPSMAEAVDIISGRHSAGRTHFSTKGLKTDATVDELRELFSARRRKGISAELH